MNADGGDASKKSAPRRRAGTTATARRSRSDRAAQTGKAPTETPDTSKGQGQVETGHAAQGNAGDTPLGSSDRPSYMPPRRVWPD